MATARIVVIEDEPAIRRGVADVLRASGYDVAEAADGARGLEEAVQTEPGLLPSPDLLRETLARLPAQASVWSRFSAWLAPPARFRWAMAVAAAVLLLQTAAIVALLGGFGGGKTYELLSVPPADQAAGPRIVVAFREDVPERILRETIRGLHGQVVAGPSPLGFYTVELPPEEASLVDQRLEQLRARKEAIRFAERAP